MIRIYIYMCVYKKNDGEPRSPLTLKDPLGPCPGRQWDHLRAFLRPPAARSGQITSAFAPSWCPELRDPSDGCRKNLGIS